MAMGPSGEPGGHFYHMTLYFKTYKLIRKYNYIEKPTKKERSQKKKSQLLLVIIHFYVPYAYKRNNILKISRYFFKFSL